MAWPDTPTLEPSRARWIPAALVRQGRGSFRPERPHQVVALLGLGCPSCGDRLEADTARLDALFRHGGFGATLCTTRRRCPSCRYALVVEQAEERPPR